MKMTNKYEEIIQKFIWFSNACPEMRAAAIIGSRARTNQPADELSDLDIVVFSTDPEKYLNDTQWLDEIGNYAITFLERLPVGNGKERRVMFQDALDVDFAILPANQATEMFKSSEVQAVFKKGMKVIFDKDGLFSNLVINPSSSVSETTSLPSKNVVQNTLQDFWYHCIWSMKKILRGEYWTAKMCVDQHMKNLTLKLIEWHYLVNQNESIEIWHNGRFFERWVDQDIQDEMKDCFAHYDQDDLVRALKNNMRLFSRLSKNVTKILTIPYPEESERFVWDWFAQVEK